MHTYMQCICISYNGKGKHRQQKVYLSAVAKQRTVPKPPVDVQQIHWNQSLPWTS